MGRIPGLNQRQGTESLLGLSPGFDLAAGKHGVDANARASTTPSLSFDYTTPARGCQSMRISSHYQGCSHQSINSTLMLLAGMVDHRILSTTSSPRTTMRDPRRVLSTPSPQLSALWGAGRIPCHYSGSVSVPGPGFGFLRQHEAGKRIEGVGFVTGFFGGKFTLDRDGQWPASRIFPLIIRIAKANVSEPGSTPATACSRGTRYGRLRSSDTSGMSRQLRLKAEVTELRV